MRKPALMTLLCLCAAAAGAQPGTVQPQTHTYVDDPLTGWHWYNEPQPEEDDESEPPPQDTVPLSSLPAAVQKKVMQKMTQEALDTAIMVPSAENAARFLTLQRYWLTTSTEFERSARKALLYYPALDYNLEHSHYNSTVPLQLAATREKEEQAVRELSGRYGLFLFYRGREPVDNQMSTVVAQFAQDNGITLIPVSMDGARSDALPGTRTDSGQAAAMGVSHFPALYLVDPASEHYQPLAFGFMTQDALSRRFLEIATDFAAD